MADKVDSEAIYLYCFASSTLLSTVEGMGVDGKNPVFLLTHRDVVAVVSFVSAQEFSGQSAEHNMGELTWVGPRAFRHEEVVERVMLHSPVLPVRFGTIFDSDENLQERLRKHHETIRYFLNTVSGKDEWAVKVLLNRAMAGRQYSGETRDAGSEDMLLSPGALYLEERKMRSFCKEALNRSREEMCKSTGQELGRIAFDLRVRKAFAREAQGDGMDMIGNWVFLVSRDLAPDFCACARAANEECAVSGLVFEVSGPWPPYNFCPSLEEEGAT